MKDILKQIRLADSDIVLSADEATELCSVIDSLSEKAKDGETYRSELENETVRLFAMMLPALPDESTHSICKAISTDDLRKLSAALVSKSEKLNAPQLFKDEKTSSEANSQYRF